MRELFEEVRPPARDRLVAFKATSEELVQLRRAARRSGASSVSMFLRRLVAAALHDASGQ